MTWHDLLPDGDIVCVCGHEAADHRDDIDAACCVCDCDSFEENVGQ